MKASDWIKVEDRLPEAEEDVLVYDGNAGVTIASYEPHYGWIAYEDGVLEAVTHWSPLELPEWEDQKPFMDNSEFDFGHNVKHTEDSYDNI